MSDAVVRFCLYLCLEFVEMCRVQFARGDVKVRLRGWEAFLEHLRKVGGLLVRLRCREEGVEKA